VSTLKIFKQKLKTKNIQNLTSFNKKTHVYISCYYTWLSLPCVMIIGIIIFFIFFILYCYFIF